MTLETQSIVGLMRPAQKPCTGIVRDSSARLRRHKKAEKRVSYEPEQNNLEKSKEEG
jgi:hypothetical protein